MSWPQRALPGLATAAIAAAITASCLVPDSDQAISIEVIEAPVSASKKSKGSPLSRSASRTLSSIICMAMMMWPSTAPIMPKGIATMISKG